MISPIVNLGQESYIIDNFQTLRGESAWMDCQSGTNATFLMGTPSTYQGVSIIRVGTTALGRGGMRKGRRSIIFNTGDLYSFQWSSRHITLATAAQDYVTRSGFFDDETADPTNGAYFEYNRAVNGNVWTCITNSGGVKTTTVTAISPAAPFKKHNIVVNGLGRVDFMINGVLVASHDTNIPSSRVGLIINSIRTAGTTQTQTIAVGQALLYYKLAVNRFL